jgi:alpha-ketoglutarate-dependent taurine dioxygenase
MTASSLSIVPPSGALGAEVTGMELGRSLDDNTFDVVQQALLHHLVLVVRSQGRVSHLAADLVC